MNVYNFVKLINVLENLLCVSSNGFGICNENHTFYIWINSKKFYMRDFHFFELMNTEDGEEEVIISIRKDDFELDNSLTVSTDSECIYFLPEHLIFDKNEFRQIVKPVSERHKELLEKVRDDLNELLRTDKVYNLNNRVLAVNKALETLKNIKKDF